MSNLPIFRQVSDSLQESSAEHRESRHRLRGRDQLLRPRYSPRRQLHQLRSSRGAGTWSAERGPYLRALPEEILRGAHAHDARVRQDQGEVKCVLPEDGSESGASTGVVNFRGGNWVWRRRIFPVVPSRRVESSISPWLTSASGNLEEVFSPMNESASSWAT